MNGTLAETVSFVFIMIVLIAVVFYLIMYNASLKLEKRIGKYCINAHNDKSISLFDFIYNEYYKLRNITVKYFKKSVFLKKYATRYNKYITYENEKDKCSMDFIADKFYLGIFFICLGLFANAIVIIFNASELFLLGVFGFFIIDIYYIITSYIKKKQIEQDLLNAIIIMNNAFRSGRSTIQAIEIVSNELKGPISQEFKKMHLEITYGLSLETVFERFSKRVSSTEVSYITSSLSILNKTGGNIIKVFASMEKMLFSKKKLKQEMKSLTSSSKMISTILLILPLVFVGLIFLLNNSYFNPLFTTSIGRIILAMIVIIYATYIYAVIRIMRVRY